MAESICLTNEDVSTLLKNIQKYASLISYSAKPLGNGLVGFLGSHYHLTVDTTLKKYGFFGQKKTLHFFIKMFPKTGEHSAYIEGIGAFKKETQAFKHLIPMLLKATNFLQYPWSPSCHLIKNDLLVFDDLSVKNYRMAQGREILDYDHCIAAMKTLADMHAASIIFEHSNRLMNPQRYKISDLYPEAVEENCYVHKEGHTRAKWFTSVVNACVFLCKLMGHEKDMHRIPDIMKRAASLVGPSSEWCNVFSHGDLWSNNFMFLYNSDGSIKHCCIVDFQLARYAPCALDLMCCIHLIAPLKLRYFFGAKFVDTYYERLSYVLEKAGLDAGEKLPRSQLDEGCRKYKTTAVMEALLYGTTIWVPNKVSSELLVDPSRCMEMTLGDRSSVMQQAYEEDAFFKSQMTDLMEELFKCS